MGKLKSVINPYLSVVVKNCISTNLDWYIAAARVTSSYDIIASVSGGEVYRTDDAGIKNIGSNRELFVDHFLISELNNAELKLHEPRDEGAVMYFDNAWEGQFSGYCTIIKEDNLYKPVLKYCKYY